MFATAWKNLCSFDIFATPHDSVKKKGFIGGLVSIFSILVCLGLVLWEVSRYFSDKWNCEIIVDLKHKDQMSIQFDIVFPRVPCMSKFPVTDIVIGLDVTDAFGEYQMNVFKNITKQRIDSDGNAITEEEVQPRTAPPAEASGECGSCYAATLADPSSKLGISCCNSCDDVIQAYKKSGLPLPPLSTFKQCMPSSEWKAMLESRSHEGCRVDGTIRTSRIPGNFHFAPGSSFQMESVHIHDLRGYEGLKFNFTHTIHKLSFDRHEPSGRKIPNGLQLGNPLEGVSKVGTPNLEAFHYYLKVIATEIHQRGSDAVETYQYSATHHHSLLQPDGLPGVFFDMDISPLVAVYSEDQEFFWALLVNIFAIIGGVFAVASLLAAALYEAERRLAHKRELGKAF